MFNMGQINFSVLCLCNNRFSGGSRGGARASPALFGVKKEEMTEGRKAG